MRANIQHSLQSLSIFAVLRFACTYLGLHHKVIVLSYMISATCSFKVTCGTLNISLLLKLCRFRSRWLQIKLWFFYHWALRSLCLAQSLGPSGLPPSQLVELLAASSRNTFFWKYKNCVYISVGRAQNKTNVQIFSAPLTDVLQSNLNVNHI